MAGRQNITPDDAPDESVESEQQAVIQPAARPATVAQQRYAQQEGWELGNTAPADRFVEIDAQGEQVGKPSAKLKPGTYGRQVAVKGAVVDAATRAALGLD